MIGVGEGFTDELDGMDAFQFSPLGNEYIMLRSRPVMEDGTATERFTFDFRENDLAGGNTKAWLMELWYFHDQTRFGTQAQPVDVRIQWPTISRIPDDVSISIFSYNSGFGDPDRATLFDPDNETLLVEDLRETNELTISVDLYHGLSFRKKRFWVVASTDGAIFTHGLNEEKALPLTTGLKSVAPNPFNSTVAIRFDLARAARTRLRVFNTLGKEVVTLRNEIIRAGRHSVEWNADSFASGVYFVRFETAGEIPEIRKLILLK